MTDTELPGLTIVPPWYEVLHNEVGVKEIRGEGRHSERILEYLASVDTLPAHLQGRDETAWCSALINWAMEQLGLPRTEKANARSWMAWGAPLRFPLLGCVTILWRGQRSGWQGHVGCLVELGDDFVGLLGGNQSNEVNISHYPRDRVLGYRTL